MFDIGLPELVLIVVVFLVFFGAAKFGRLGKALGSTWKSFKSGLKDDEEKKKD